jgi:hypothetical protein
MDGGFIKDIFEVDGVREGAVSQCRRLHNDPITPTNKCASARTIGQCPASEYGARWLHTGSRHADTHGIK